jgi:hypothetical protein
LRESGVVGLLLAGVVHDALEKGRHAVRDRSDPRSEAWIPDQLCAGTSHDQQPDCSGERRQVISPFCSGVTRLSVVGAG